MYSDSYMEKGASSYSVTHVAASSAATVVMSSETDTTDCPSKTSEEAVYARFDALLKEVAVQEGCIDEQIADTIFIKLKDKNDKKELQERIEAKLSSLCKIETSLTTLKDSMGSIMKHISGK